MRNRPTADRVAPRLGVYASIALHVGLVVLLFVSFSKKLDLPTDATPLVPVDLVTISDQTNIAPMEKPVEAATPPDAQNVDPNPVEVAPPKFEVAPDAKPAPKEKPKPEVKPEPKPDAKPKAEPKKDAKFDINDIEKLLSKKKQPNAKVGTRDIQGVGAQTGMTADLAALIQSQIYRCWSPPTGSPHPERLIVKFEVFLNRDGSVAQPPQLAADTAGAAQSDPYMAAAVGAARRAIYTCSPYKLPPDKYAIWRNPAITFNPRLLEQ